MNPKRDVNQRLAVKALLIIIAGGILLLSVLALSRIATASPLDQEILEAKAIVVAQEVGGLQGAPTAQKAVYTTLGEWDKMINAELGKDAAQFGLTPDMPVFVLALRGSIESRLVGSLPPPGQSQPEHYESMIVVLDARTGGLVQIGNYYESSQMPVQVP